MYNSHIVMDVFASTTTQFFVPDLLFEPPDFFFVLELLLEFLDAARINFFFFDFDEPSVF